MTPDALDRVLTDGYAFDTETWLTEPGIAAPNLVCASIYRDGKGDLLDKPKALEIFQWAFSGHTMILANAPYDMTVMIAHAAKLGINLIPAVFEAYRQRNVYDVLLAEQLHALAQGHMGYDPISNKTTHYSLEDVTAMVIKRFDAKANDMWRKDYRTLDGIPMELWPEQARTYPIDDVRNTYDVAVAQLSPYGDRARRNRNLHDLHNQQYTDFCLRLGACWGLTVNPHTIDSLESKTIEDRAERQADLLAQGYLRTETKKGVAKVIKNTAYVKRKVAEAFGVSGKCTTCQGTAKVPGETKHPECQGLGCDSCVAGKIPKLKKHRDCKGVGCGDCIGGKVPASYKGCPDCSGTGLDLASAPYPITETGGVSTGRDALNESGDDELLEFAAYDETAKVLSTYIPWLREGLRDGERIPLTLRPYVLAETGRIRYGGVVHQLPRDLGVRECIEAHEGWTLITCDWEGAELVTHAQNCYDLVGFSKMGDALNEGIKVHDQLGAMISGVTYEHMLANRKTDKFLGGCRQAAKPINFGAPGLMGAPTLVLQQRKQGPDTQDPLNPDRKYKGLRFCLLAGGETACGHTKVTQWGNRQITPTCVRCIEVAADIIKTWKAIFPENIRYFEYCKQVYNTGSMKQQYTGRIRSGMTMCAAANGPFQGLAADAMKLAIQWMSYEMYCVPDSVLYGTRLILPVHDEAIVEALDEQAPAAAERVSQIMVAALSEMCPKLSSIIAAEAALMKTWHKSAEPAYNEAGTLIPWEPEE